MVSLVNFTKHSRKKYQLSTIFTYVHTHNHFHITLSLSYTVKKNHKFCHEQKYQALELSLSTLELKGTVSVTGVGQEFLQSRSMEGSVLKCICREGKRIFSSWLLLSGSLKCSTTYRVGQKVHTFFL